MSKAKNIINEWFAELPRGYALPPYSKEEKEVLRRVVEARGIDYSLVESKLEDDPSQGEVDSTDMEEPTRPKSRFRAESAPFMENPTELGNFLISRYTDGSVEVSGFESLFKEMKELPGSRLQSVAKILHDNTNRELFNGTFKMGDNERLLRGLLNRYLKIRNSTSDDLFLSIIYNGKITMLDNSVDINPTISVEGTNGVNLKAFRSLKSVNFGPLPPELSETLNGIFSIYRLTNDKDIRETATSFEINDALKVVQRPEIVNELEQLLQSQQVSNIEAIKKMAQRVRNMIDSNSIGRMASKFVDGVDRTLRSKLQGVSYWAVIGNTMVYISTSNDVYELLKPNDRTNTISTSILNMKDSRIFANAQSIHKELIEGNEDVFDVLSDVPNSERRNIINEWFANLPKGMATEPYSDEELNVLSKVLNENGYSNLIVG